MCQQISARPLTDSSEPPKVALGELPGASPSTLRAALGHPEELPGAAKPRICKRLQREHQLRPPSCRTWVTLAHPAPPVVDLHLTLTANTVLASPLRQASPPAGPAGSADSERPAATCADPGGKTRAFIF